MKLPPWLADIHHEIDDKEDSPLEGSRLYPDSAKRSVRRWNSVLSGEMDVLDACDEEENDL